MTIIIIWSTPDIYIFILVFYIWGTQDICFLIELVISEVLHTFFSEKNNFNILMYLRYVFLNRLALGLVLSIMDLGFFSTYATMYGDLQGSIKLI